MLKFSNEINGMNINIQLKPVVDAATFLDEFKTIQFSSFFAVPLLFFYFFFKINRATKTFSAVYTVARYQSTSIYA